MKKKILVIINKNINSGPNTVARGAVIGDSVDSNECIIDEHILRDKNESLCSSFIRLYKKVKINDYDILHSHCLLPDIFSSSVSFLLGRKHISTVHNIPNEDYIFRYGRLKGFTMYLLHLFFLTMMSDKLICISNTVMNSLPLLLRNKSLVIHNFVDNKFFQSSCTEQIELFYCGHFSALKDPSFIINNISSYDINFKFTLFGDGDLLDYCKGLVVDDSRFDFRGRCEDNYLSYKREGIFIHSSNTEGFCLAVAEALASNMKVVVPNIEVFNEFKNTLGFSNIYIYERGSSSSFNDTLNQALNSKFIQPNNIDYLRLYRFKKELYKLYALT
ncbi:glycosyltransferase [Photobacterium leiognathi]|uniref:glycosyltransferase n=1 Tax=Photobacterium leiognathi TaxID=553611 RepID=UPI002732E131|nr:glycosyltransferase [Photobacterium leiognathi]